MSPQPKEALCIGGPRHGQMTPTFDAEMVFVAKPLDFEPWKLDSPMTVQAMCTTKGVYLLQKLITGHLGDDEWVWVLLWKGWEE